MKLIKKWILIGIPVIIIIAFPMHFVFDLSNNSKIVGAFAPVNESIWEHLKMAFWPTIIWWLLGYFILKNKTTISVEKWFFACLIAAITAPLIIIIYYYTYTGAFGINSEILNILSLFFAVIGSQYLGLVIYNKLNLPYYYFYVSLIVIILLAILFVVWTFNPPHIPLFRDSTTGFYGIEK